MTCPDCKHDLLPWFDPRPSDVGCRVLGVRCSLCGARWTSERTERIYEDLHSDTEMYFVKIVAAMDFPVDAKKEEAA